MTVALYTTHLVRHLPLSGQVSGLLQLHVRGYIYIYIYIYICICVCVSVCLSEINNVSDKS